MCVDSSGYWWYYILIVKWYWIRKLTKNVKWEWFEGNLRKNKGNLEGNVKLLG